MNSNRKHYIITSTNEIDLYIEFAPSVYQMWKKYLKCTYVLVIVTDKSADHPLIKRLKNFCDEIYLFKSCENVHTGIQAKTLRMWMASQFGDNICTLTDIDQYLFDFDWLKRCILPAWTEDKFVEIGHNAYWDTAENGKFPMYYTTAPSTVFSKIINPENIKNFNDWFMRFNNITDPIDNKEHIGPVFNNFSDESLLRYLIVRHPDQAFVNKVIVKVIREDFKLMRASKRLDRSSWPQRTLDNDFLDKMMYLDCNPLRPFNRYSVYLIPIIHWMKLDTSKEKVYL